jgi:hypothetical protein
MAELKTKKTNLSVHDFLNSIEDDQIREDSFKIAEMMEKATKSKPKIWGTNIVGFGDYHYKYASGREFDWMIIAFAPRKKQITLYINGGFTVFHELLPKLGKHSHGKGCLHIKRLADVDIPTLRKIIKTSVDHVGRM